MRRAWAIGFAIAVSALAHSLEINAKSGIIVDERSGVVLWAKDPDAIRYPASITKILTAILLVETTLPDEVISAPQDCEVEGAAIHLKPGEKLTARDLLKAILLRSANDACHMLAVHVAGSDLAFAELMNARAKQIGCTRTHFMAPHGLHNDKHYTTARDMALIAREAMKYPQICEIVATRKSSIERSINKQDTFLISKNKWLEKGLGADGIKTGYTKVARSTFVGSATRNGYRFITVILCSDKWEEDQSAMMEYAFKFFTSSKIRSKDDQMGGAPVRNGLVGEVPGLLATDVFYAHRKDVQPKLSERIVYKPDLAAPVTQGTEIGTLELEDAHGWKASIPILAGASVAAVAAPASANAGLVVVLGALGGSTILLRRKSRRMAGAKLPRQG